MIKKIHIGMSVLFAVLAGSLTFHLVNKQVATGDPGAFSGFLFIPFMVVIGGFIGYLFGLSILARKNPHYKRRLVKLLIASAIIIAIILIVLGVASWYHELQVPK